MIRYKVLLGKGLAAESSQERAYEPFGFVEQSGTFHSSNSRIVDWRILNANVETGQMPDGEEDAEKSSERAVDMC